MVYTVLTRVAVVDSFLNTAELISARRRLRVALLSGDAHTVDSGGAVPGGAASTVANAAAVEGSRACLRAVLRRAPDGTGNVTAWK